MNHFYGDTFCLGNGLGLTTSDKTNSVLFPLFSNYDVELELTVIEFSTHLFTIGGQHELPSTCIVLGAAHFMHCNCLKESPCLLPGRLMKTLGWVSRFCIVSNFKWEGT